MASSVRDSGCWLEKISDSMDVPVYRIIMFLGKRSDGKAGET